MGIFGKSAAQKRIDNLVKQNDELKSQAGIRGAHNVRLIGEKLAVGRALNEALTERDSARQALAEIAAMETAGCAPIGRKMAARARHELPPKQGSDPVRKVMEADTAKRTVLTGH